MRRSFLLAVPFLILMIPCAYAEEQRFSDYLLAFLAGSINTFGCLGFGVGGLPAGWYRISFPMGGLRQELIQVE